MLAQQLLMITQPSLPFAVTLPLGVTILLSAVASWGVTMIVDGPWSHRCQQQQQQQQEQRPGGSPGVVVSRLPGEVAEPRNDDAIGDRRWSHIASVLDFYLDFGGQNGGQKHFL